MTWIDLILFSAAANLSLDRVKPAAKVVVRMIDDAMK